MNGPDLSPVTQADVANAALRVQELAARWHKAKAHEGTESQIAIASNQLSAIQAEVARYSLEAVPPLRLQWYRIVHRFSQSHLVRLGLFRLVVITCAVFFLSSVALCAGLTHSLGGAFFGGCVITFAGTSIAVLCFQALWPDSKKLEVFQQLERRWLRKKHHLELLTSREASLSAQYRTLTEVWRIRAEYDRAQSEYERLVALLQAQDENQARERQAEQERLVRERQAEQERLVELQRMRQLQEARLAEEQRLYQLEEERRTRERQQIQQRQSVQLAEAQRIQQTEAERARKALLFILQEDSRIGTQTTGALGENNNPSQVAAVIGNYCAHAEQLDLSGCPADFRVAYRHYLQAFRGLQSVLSQLPNSFLDEMATHFFAGAIAGGINALLRQEAIHLGMLGADLDRAKRELQVKGRNAQEEVRLARQAVERIGAKYGAAL